MKKHLLILGCSQTKIDAESPIAAIERYDGSMYRVLRSFLRDHSWPESLSVAVLSAKYGLVGGMTPIENYDLRMNRDRASELAEGATTTLSEWSKLHDTISLSLGKDYLPALRLKDPSLSRSKVQIFEGGIGIKLHQIHSLLEGLTTTPRKHVEARKGRPCYFLPDWDDTLDPAFDFRKDRFSGESKAERGDIHCSRIMKPDRISDGILVSLAQHIMSKGPLKRINATDPTSLAPERLRDLFHLASDQALFGDCGAFSYVNEEVPTISVEQAVTLYELHGFDYGASIDHIPVPEVFRNGKKIQLTKAKRMHRVAITKENAEVFIRTWQKRRCTFAPVGTIQALSPELYGEQVLEYVEMGYHHLAIGGLVPLPDAEVLAIAKAVTESAKKVKNRPWIHLFGVFRPKIQPQLRALGIDSFDSATYFRKAWLRSDQNYLGTDGKWYAAIRVPMTSDPRTRKRLEIAGENIKALEMLEYKALQALHSYDKGRISLQRTLDVVSEYDQTLSRGEDHGENLIEDYRRTLKAKPWKQCNCQVCANIGIDALIFRGCNRNKRRGAHNTLMLYRMLH